MLNNLFSYQFIKYMNVPVSGQMGFQRPNTFYMLSVIEFHALVMFYCSVVFICVSSFLFEIWFMFRASKYPQPTRRKIKDNYYKFEYFRGLVYKKKPSIKIQYKQFDIFKKKDTGELGWCYILGSNVPEFTQTIYKVLRIPLCDEFQKYMEPLLKKNTTIIYYNDIYYYNSDFKLGKFPYIKRILGLLIVGTGAKKKIYKIKNTKHLYQKLLFLKAINPGQNFTVVKLTSNQIFRMNRYVSREKYLAKLYAVLNPKLY